MRSTSIGSAARATALVVTFALTSGGLSRADVLDQSNVVTTPAFDPAVVSSQSLAQTFTAGLEGLLSRIDLQIYQSTGTTGDDVTLTIRQVLAGGLPDPAGSGILFQTIIPLATLPVIDDIFQPVPLTSVDVSAGGIAVAPGMMLAISLSRTGAGSPPWVLWRAGGSDPYAGGSLYQRDGSSGAWEQIEDGFYDTGFQTYVRAVPEPGSLALVGIGVLGGVLARRRRRD